MKVSIIIPVYNAEQTIERCVESIMKNSEQDREIILIEDCSKDNSFRKCQMLAAKYGAVRCFRNERNRGVSYTRNRGLDAAVGTYTMFVDSDDWVEPNYIEEFLQIMDKYNPIMAVCGYINHDEKQNHNTEIYSWSDFSGIKECGIRDCLQSLYKKCLLQQLWNKIFRTEIIRNNQIRFDESISIGEDLRFILAYLKSCGTGRICLLNKCLYHYMRDQKGSLMFRVGYESVEEPLRNLRALYELEGRDAQSIDQMIDFEREKQIAHYAYLICHNWGMDWKEKKRLILALDAESGSALYQKNRQLYLKEKIAAILKRLKHRSDN